MSNNFSFSMIQIEEIKSRLNIINKELKSEDKFSYIGQNILDLKRNTCDFVGVDNNKYTELYKEEGLITIDPTVDFIQKSDRELLFFDEIIYKEIEDKKGNIIRPGKIINDGRANNKYSMHNGFYTFFRLDKNNVFAVVFGIDSKKYDPFKFFDLNSEDGKWFNEYRKKSNYIIYDSLRKKLSS